MSSSEPSAALPASPRWQLAGVLLNRDARWMTPHLWRFGCLVAVWLAFASAAEGITRSAAPGMVILQNLAFASALGLVAWAGFGVSGVLRDEWLGNNLQLVQLTGISSFDLLLAKLTPTCLTAASVLLLEIPCLQLCVTLGGVTPEQVWAVIWQLIWMFLVSSSITAFLATQMRAPNAIAVSSGILFLVYCLFVFVLVDLPWKAFAMGVLNHPPGLDKESSAASFFLQFALIYRSQFAGPIVNWQSFVHLLFVAATLRATALSLREKLAESRESQPPEETPPEGEAHRVNIPIWRPGYKLPPIAGNAIMWKDYHFTLGGNDMLYGKLVCFAGLIVLGLLSVIGQFASRAGDESWVSLLFLATFLSIVASLATLAVSAKRLWQLEIRERTLGALVILPMTAREIVQAKLRAFLKISLPEIVLAAFFLLLIVSFSQKTREWTAFNWYAGLLLSVPLVVCTDAAWRLLPNSLDGFGGGIQLAGLNLVIWVISGFLAVAVSPFLGLLVMAVLVPMGCGIALHTAAYWLGNHAGALES